MTSDEGPTSIDLAHEPAFSVGGLAVSPATREVRGADLDESLEPRVMQVLVALARRRGHVVSRDDLVQSCWSGRIVGDDAIHRCIAKVRRLGEASGAFTVETIARVGYRLDEAAGAVEETAVQTLSAPGGKGPVLAVLPFDNLSGDADLLFFSDGVSEEILHALSRNTNLQVIGRASSFQFRGPNKVVRTIAGELKTSHLLDGSVRRAGDRVRVSAHLMDAATQTVVWSDRFDRSLADIFALQDEVAAAVAEALDVRFGGRQPQSAISAEAYDLFLRGSVWSRDVSLDSQRRALALLEDSVMHAPGLARAWGELALTRAQLRYLGETGVTRESIHVAAEKALALDKRSQGAWGALYLATPLFAFREADALFDRARKLGLNLSLPRAIHLMDIGRFRDARVELAKAMSIDPFQQVQLFYGAVDELADGHLQSARAMVREAAERWPHVAYLAAYAVVLATHAGDGVEVDRLVSPDRLARHPLDPWTQSVAVKIAALRNGPPRDLFAALKKAEAGAGSSLVEAMAFSAEVAGPDSVLKGAGAEPNFAALRRPELGLASLFLPLYSALRNDPRFPALCAKLGLAQYWIETDQWPDCAEQLPYDLRAACRAAVS
jgi:TolB-like protein